MTEGTGTPPSLAAMQALVREGRFEETLAALEAVVDHLERGRLSIDESVTWYEVGLGLTRRCSDLLHQAELRISTIEERYATFSRDEDLLDENGS